MNSDSDVTFKWLCTTGGEAKEGKEEDKEEDDTEEAQDDIDIENGVNIDIEIFKENGSVNFQHSASSAVGPQSSS